MVAEPRGTSVADPPRGVYRAWGKDLPKGAARCRRCALLGPRLSRLIYWPRLRLSRAIRPAAWALVAAGVAAPKVRRTVKLPKGVALGAAALVPAAVYVAAPKGRARGAAVCVAQMWAYLAAYEMPNDDPQALRDRVHVNYPIAIDRALGFGRLPTQRLQDAFSTPGSTNRFEKVLAWSHWGLVRGGRTPPWPTRRCDGLRSSRVRPPGCTRCLTSARWSTGRRRRRHRGGRRRTDM